jgi:hypothetical protein
MLPLHSPHQWQHTTCDLHGLTLQKQSLLTKQTQRALDLVHQRRDQIQLLSQKLLQTGVRHTTSVECDRPNPMSQSNLHVA